MATTKIPNLPLVTIARDEDIFIIDDVDRVTSKITWADIKKSLSNINTTLTVSPGSNLGPGIAFGDSLSGIYAPVSGTLVISTNNVDRVVVDIDGKVGIGGAPITDSKLSIIGGTCDMGSNKIINVALCTEDNDCANKAYVDNVAGGGAGGIPDLSTLPSLP